MCGSDLSAKNNTYYRGKNDILAVPTIFTKMQHNSFHYFFIKSKEIFIFYTLLSYLFRCYSMVQLTKGVFYMKIKFILFPCLIGLITLASCNSNTKDTTKTTKEDEAPTTSIEVPTTTFIETSTGIETTTVETTTTEETSSGVSNVGSYEDDDEWKELHA